MSSSIRVGFIGAGANTRLRHLPGLAEIDGVSLSMVANRSEASSRAVAEEFGITRIAPDWKTVVEDPEIDAVCIGTWPYMHAEISIAALKEGKHVLTEARMASSLGEARAMYAESVAHPDLVAQSVEDQIGPLQEHAQGLSQGSFGAGAGDNPVYRNKVRTIDEGGAGRSLQLGQSLSQADFVQREPHDSVQYRCLFLGPDPLGAGSDRHQYDDDREGA